MSEPLSLSVVVPLCDAAPTLDAALTAIRASALPRDSYEIIVVDDWSSDASEAIAARHADTVVRLNGRGSGPAYARNRGVDRARADIVAFVDPDVLVRPDTLPRMLATLMSQQGTDAVSAGHGECAGPANFVSQYWNQLLRFGEQRHAGRCAHLNASCAAVRRGALISAGMYDEWRFATPCLEGVELGQRLRQAGHAVVFDSELEVVHVKHWTLGTLCREVWHRSTLLSRSLGYQMTSVNAPGDVVFTLSRTLTPILAVVATLTLAAGLVPRSYVSTELGIAIAALLVSNSAVHRFCAGERGVGFAIAAAPLHLLMQTVSAMGLCIGWVLRDAVGDALPGATIQAYSEVGLEVWPPVPRRP